MTNPRTDPQVPTAAGGLHPNAHDDDSDRSDNEQPFFQAHPARANGQNGPDGDSLPRWVHQTHKTSALSKIGSGLKQVGHDIMRWIHGPVPPVILCPNPIFPRAQEMPVRLVDRFLPKKRYRIAALGVYYLLWALIWGLMVAKSNQAGESLNYGDTQSIWCGYNLWNFGNGCGLNGNDCRPFTSSSLAFRCPANCEALQLLDPHTVGNKTLRYEGLVVGGPDPYDSEAPAIYRADSFVCQAAIHAGIVSNTKGGCGVLTTSGSSDFFYSSKRNGIKSTMFPSSFPKSFSFVDEPISCPSDARWPLLAVTAIATAILALFTTSPPVLFFSTFFMLCLHTGMVSDPPNYNAFNQLVSTVVGRLLPAGFISVVIYWTSTRRLFYGLPPRTFQVEKTVLFLGPYFIGILNNYTFAPLIPIQRLTPADIKAQPGAVPALIIIISALLCIVVVQIYYIRKSGLLARYLAIYGLFVAVLLIFLPIPGLRIRIHHYILALLLLPGTAIPTRASVLYHGLLLGLFVNGAMRWGFASILETPSALGEDGAGQGGANHWWGAAANAPNVTATVGPLGNNITFTWGQVPKLDLGVEGISILVNDVERYRWYVDESAGNNGEYTYARNPIMTEILGDDGLVFQQQAGTKVHSRNLDFDHLYDDDDQAPLTDEPDVNFNVTSAFSSVYEQNFFRFAWLKGPSAGRYSKAGLWDSNGVWWPAK